MPVCRSCGEDNPSRARFCLACATPLQDEPVTRDTRKVVTVLFADVVGSTELAERLDAEPFRAVMTRYFQEMRSVLVRHGGRVEKFIGDAVMAAFGVPVLHEDDALRAVRSAVQMREAVDQLNTELSERWGVSIRLRIGINTGEVIAGQTEGNQGLLAGDAVIHAARLEQIAYPGEILLGDATYQLVKDFVDLDRTDARSVKGKTDQMKCHSLSGLRLEHAPVRTVQAPLVGRGAELEKMRSLFSEAVGDETCKLVTVTGWPGIGKSRLVTEFLESVNGRARVASGRCLSYGQGITFWPFLEVVKALAGWPDRSTPEESLARLRDIVEGDERADAITAHVAQIIGLSATTTPFHETYWALRALLERVASALPLIVVFEDIHWGEPMFLDLVEYLRRSIRSAPVLLLCTARPELFDARPDWASSIADADTTIALERLADTDAGALVETMFGTALPRDLVAAIEQAAEGNPLYIEQMVGSLKDTGYVPGPDLAEGAAVTIPPTVNALIAARLDRLDDVERTLLEGASVIGKEFSIAALKELCGQEVQGALEPYLDVLVRKQMLKPARHGWTVYRFQHNLIRETTYSALPKARRGDLHEKVARAMEDAPGSLLTQFDEITGYHLEQASRYFTEMEPLGDRSRLVSVDAGHRLAAAGRKAFARDDNPSAINLLQRACALLPSDDSIRLACMPELAEALKEAGDFDATRRVLDDVMALGTEGNLGVRSRAQLVALDLDFRIDPRRKTAEGREQLRALIEALESTGDDQGLAKAWNLLGHLYWWRGQFMAMADASLNAIDRARHCHDDREEAWGHTGLAISTAMGPAPVVEGIRTCERILDTVRQNRMVEARTQMALALLRAWQGDFAAARSAVDQARLIHEDMGLKLRAATDLPQLAGAIELLAGNAAAAEDILRRGQEVIEQMGEKVYIPVLRVRLAQAVYVQGRLDEAEALIAEVVQGAEADSVFLQVWGRTMQAKLLVQSGELGRAQAIALEAVAITEGTDHLSMQADTLVDLAEVCLLGGRREDASDPIARALVLYERKGNVVGANTARLLLELGGRGGAERPPRRSRRSGSPRGSSPRADNP